MSKKNYYPVVNTNEDYDLFESGEALWLWFVMANQALNDGARHTAALGLYNRPCQPCDILSIVDRLRRGRRLLWEHIKVLHYYGMRQTPPDRFHPKEMRAASLWAEAMEILEDAFLAKGLIAEKSSWVRKHDPKGGQDDMPVYAMTAANETTFSEFRK
ncbi:MAG: hypothetical protein CL561_06480 [Alphaproteobacteria bacterium]|nr:hypothetical protein [Alphaproteobacteria bacterium]|tara:strand:- start:1103 stop:1576 length:474 start_codon:yes stop_codon:yes gene_type:complete